MNDTTVSVMCDNYLPQLTLSVQVKKMHPEAKLPTYAHESDACMDFYALDNYETVSVPNEYGYLEYRTGIAIAVPKGYVGLIFPRSSISNTILHLANSVGVIDSGYTGEIKFRFKVSEVPGFQSGKVYEKGERIGQILLMPIPKLELREVEELPQSDRGTSGFGGSGK